MPRIEAVVFDVYGTLLDTVSAVRRHAARLGAEWEEFSTTWRQKQIEYTWVRSLAGARQHRDFARVIDDSLAYTAAAHRVSDTALLSTLRDAFDHLDAFDDAPSALAALRDKGLPCAVLSNGTPSMLAHQLRASGLEPFFDAVLSVEAVGVYKPDPRVYQLAVQRLGIERRRIAFVSGNPWDGFGAHVFGLKAFRINRVANPDEYGLRGQVTELGALTELPALLE